MFMVAVISVMAVIHVIQYVILYLSILGIIRSHLGDPDSGTSKE
jgi:hypothetical protein